MRLKIIALSSLLLASILVASFALVPAQAINGPVTPKLHIKNWGSDIDEFLAIESGQADITDWPIYKEYIDKWIAEGRIPSQITLRDFSEFGYWFFEVYNQRWPTGVGDKLEDTMTFDDHSGTYKHYFDPNNEWDLKAWQFRLALEYLTDRDYIKTDVLKGLGYILDTEMPPVLGGWVDPVNLTKSAMGAPVVHCEQLKWHDANNNGKWDRLTENLYGDEDGSKTVTAGDIRLNNPEGLAGVTAPAVVVAGNPDLGWTIRLADAHRLMYHDADSDNIWDKLTENLYEKPQDTQDNTKPYVVKVGDTRLTKPETPALSAPALVVAGDADIGWSLKFVSEIIPSLIYSRDVPKAQRLLEDAHFKLRPDGKRQDPRKADDPAYPGYKLPLDPVIFYIRSDDINRRLAGEKLAADLVAIGVPVDSRVVAKTVAFKAVMVDYDFNIYTAGVGIGSDPDFIYSAIDSSEYWGMPYNSPLKNPPYNYPSIGWSVNTAGSAYHDLDQFTMYKVYLGATKPEIETGVKSATYLENKYAIHIPLWSYASVQGYRTGWNDVINQFGYGVSGPVVGGAIPWSFTTMWHTDGRDTINWAFKSKPEDLSVISAEWVWDWNILMLIYENMLVTNPYNPADDWGWLASKWDIGEWTYEGKPATAINLTLRKGVLWHDGTPLTKDDLAFSIRFTRDCGPGVAWNYPMVMNVDHVEKWEAGGESGVKVYMNIKSYFALHRIGWLPILNRAVWMAASVPEGFGYTEAAEGSSPDIGTFVDRTKVRNFLLYSDNWYKPSDNLKDLAEDGSGPWIFVECDPGLDLYYDLVANRNWWMSQEDLAAKVSEAFHLMGDVNRDRQVSSEDLSLIAHAMLTNPASGGPAGDWWRWNVDADLDKSGDVTGDDYARCGKSFGMNAG